jgi:hypothetical protein
LDPGITIGVEPEIQTVLSGGTAVFTITITNTGNVELADIHIDALEAPECEDAFNQLGVGALAVGESVDYSCSRLYLSPQPSENEVLFVVTAVDTESNLVSAEAQVIIEIVAPIQQVLLPAVSNGYVAGEPNNHICQAQPIVTNLDTYFLPDDQNDWYHFALGGPGNVIITLSDFIPQEGQLIAYRGSCTAPIFLKNNGNFEALKVLELGIQPAENYVIWVITDGNFSTARPYKLHVAVTVP